MKHCDPSGGLGRAFLALIILSSMSVARPESATGKSPSIEAPSTVTGIQFSITNGRALLNVENVKLSDVLKAVTSRTGLVVILDPEADRPLSVFMRDVSPSAMLKHLLKDFNVAEVWQPAPPSFPGGEIVLAKLYVYPKGRSAPGEDPFIIGGKPVAGKPVFTIQNPDPKADRRPAPSAEEGYRLSAASVKAYQEKKKLKSDTVLRRMIRPDSVSPAKSPTVEAASLKAYLEKKARIKAKSLDGYGAARAGIE